jgi:hypothetical protein
MVDNPNFAALILRGDGSNMRAGRVAREGAQ